MEDTATAFTKCATPNEAAKSAGQVADKVKAASKDSLQAFLKFATDPVAGLSVAYESLGSSRALGAGLGFGAVFTLCVLAGTYRLIPEFLRPPGIGGFLKLLICAMVPFATLAGACAIARLVFHGKGSFSNDSFIAGASVLPFGFLMLVATILGAGNMEVIGALGVFALCLTILMLFAGCTRITMISERLATVAVPVMLMLSAWFSKIIYAAMINSAAGSPSYPMNPMFQ